MYLNTERARDLMAEHNIDVLVASTPENVICISGDALKPCGTRFPFKSDMDLIEELLAT